MLSIDTLIGRGTREGSKTHSKPAFDYDKFAATMRKAPDYHLTHPDVTPTDPEEIELGLKKVRQMYGLGEFAATSSPAPRRPLLARLRPKLLT